MKKRKMGGSGFSGTGSKAKCVTVSADATQQKPQRPVQKGIAKPTNSRTSVQRGKDNLKRRYEDDNDTTWGGY